MPSQSPHVPCPAPHRHAVCGWAQHTFTYNHNNSPYFVYIHLHNIAITPRDARDTGFTITKSDVLSPRSLQQWPKTTSSHSSQRMNKAPPTAFLRNIGRSAAVATSSASTCDTTRTRSKGWRRMSQPRHGWVRYAVPFSGACAALRKL